MYQSACRKTVSPEVQYSRVREEAQSGHLDAALKDVEHAFQEYSGKDIGWAWQFRVLKAHILVLRGSNSEALQLLKGDLPVPLRFSEVAVRRRMVQGLAHDFSQQYDMAEEDLQEAEKLARTYQPSLLADVEQSKGTLEVDQGKFDEAEVSFQLALTIARQLKLQHLESAALGSLGNVAMNQRKYDEATERYKAALRLSTALQTDSSLPKTLGNIGWNYFELGDFENALSRFNQAVEASQRSGLVGDRVYWLTGVANSYFALRKYAEAESILLQALEVARKSDEKSTLTECLNDLATVALETGRTELAERYNKEASELERAGLDRSNVLSSELIRARILYHKRDFTDAEPLFRKIAEDPGATKSENWEAKARLAKLYDDENKVAKAEKEYWEVIETFREAMASVGQDELRLSFLSGGIGYYDDYIGFLIAHGRSSDALKAAELSRARTLTEGLSSRVTAKTASLQSTRGLQSQQVAKRLGATVLFYWVGQRHSYLWAITPVTTAYFTLAAASEIDSAVKTYRDAVAESKDVAETEQAAGEKLYAMLVAPAQKFIAQNSRVILLPDGSLYSLNFETLIVPGAKPHFWIEDVTLTTASSLSLLASGANRPPPKQKNLLLVGDALKANDEFDPLPQAEDEMQNVEHYFPEASRTVLKREQATPAAYLASNPERYAYLHFVTHGTASRAQPLESAVILSKEPASDTYKLYARDIVTRHLNAELVTISACNGSGTRAYSGEGLVGLSWAFLRAGAHNVVGALWEVSNAPSTGQLMDVFYNGLSRGEDPATALREAKLSFLRSTDSKSVFRKPYYWAPFQLYAGS
jgi:CHAT domain-containing protein/Tfp pilus assembly protein PilF